MNLTAAEQELLLNDPFVLRVLADAYRSGELIECWPDPWAPRGEELWARSKALTEKPFNSMLLDMTPDAYRRAKKLVKTYETHFKTGGEG